MSYTTLTQEEIAKIAEEIIDEARDNGAKDDEWTVDGLSNFVDGSWDWVRDRYPNVDHEEVIDAIYLYLADQLL